MQTALITNHCQTDVLLNKMSDAIRTYLALFVRRLVEDKIRVHLQAFLLLSF